MINGTPDHKSLGNWDTADAARYLNCSEGTLRQWVSKRRIPFVRVGRLVRFRREDLDRWMDDRLVLPTGNAGRS